MSGRGERSTSARFPVNLCPYCGEDDLRPDEAAPDAWSCRACRRLFSVTYRGALTPGSAS